MSRFHWSAMGVIAAAFAAGLVLEYEAAPSQEDALIGLARPHSETAQPPAQPGMEDDVDGWVAGILARPLFSPTRRPPPGSPSGPLAKGNGLPRLTGVLVSEAGRLVIFAGSGDEKPTIAREGGRVGAFTVTSIGPGQVTLIGPEGKRVLRPAFSNLDRPAEAVQRSVRPPIPVGDVARNMPTPPDMGIPGVVPFAEPPAQSPPAASPAPKDLTQ